MVRLVQRIHQLVYFVESVFLVSLRTVVIMLAAGRAPVDLVQCLAGEPLTPLAQKDNTPEPIPVREMLP